MFHKNSQKRIYLTNAIYFVTIKTHDGYPYFKIVMFCKLFLEELMIIKKLKKFKLFGFVILNNHVHLLLKPNKQYPILKIIQALKKEFSRDANYLLKAGAIPESRLRGQQYSKHLKKIL